MAAAAGRKVRVQYRTSSAASPADIAGARTDTITFNQEAINITDKDDAGVQTMLDDIGTKSVEMTVEGVLINDTFLGLMATGGEGTSLHYMNFGMPGLGSLAAQWFINSFEVSGAEGAEARTFSMTVASSGTVAYTATA